MGWDGCDGSVQLVNRPDLDRGGWINCRIVALEQSRLDLERLRAHEHGRVERAVAVWLRARDVVL